MKERIPIPRTGFDFILIVEQNPTMKIDENGTVQVKHFA